MNIHFLGGLVNLYNQSKSIFGKEYEVEVLFSAYE